jgi:hypothetical protein
MGVALGLPVADGFTDWLPECDVDGGGADVIGTGAAAGSGEAFGEGLD